MERRSPATAGAAAVIVSVALLAGCATTSSVETLEKRVAHLELERERLKAQMAQDMSRLTNLHGMLTEAEATLRRSGVKLGIRMEQVEEALPSLQGGVESVTFQLTSVKHGIEALKRELFDRLGATAVYLPVDLPKTPDAVFELAHERLKAEKLREARALFDYFEASYPDDPRADDALMAVSRILEGTGDTSEAIKVYQRIHDQYGKGDQVSKALWRIGELFLAREDCDRARSVFDYLSQSYADSPEGKDAVLKVTELADTCGVDD